MSKTVHMRVPERFANFIKERAKRKDTSMAQETDKLFRHYQHMRSDLKKLEGAKKVLIIK